jgi:hypothetical protein
MTERELSGMLDAQVKKCNLTLSSYQVSMAVGISNIRDEQGHLKTVSDWKGEADLKMYDNKGWVRRDTQAVSEQ